MAINLIDDPEEFERVSVSHVKHEWAKKYGESFSSPNVKGMPAGQSASQSEAKDSRASRLASPNCSASDLVFAGVSPELLSDLFQSPRMDKWIKPPSSELRRFLDEASRIIDKHKPND